MKKPILIVVLIVFLTTAACAMPVETRWSVEPTLTLVPTLQMPTASDPAKPGKQEANIVAATGGTPAATATTAPAAPTATIDPAPTKRAVPAGVVNIMVLGSDFRPSSGHRTDAIMLVSVNTVKQTVSVVSFPRDLYVPIPGWTTQRINTAEPHGGFDTLADTMEANFAVRPSYYVMTDFESFKGIINRMGGVNVYAGSRLTDRCDLPWSQNGKCTIQPGLNKMDGDTALWYIRSRYTSNDLDRQRREQEVLSGMFVQIMSGGLQDLPGLFASYNGSVKTNLTVQAITPLLPTAARVFGDRKLIRRYALTVKEAKPFVTDTGAQVLLPDYDLINQMLDEAIFIQ